MTPELKERLDNLVKSNKVLLFMKGNKLMPQCGFSNNAVQILSILGVPFETVDVLADNDIRQGIKEYSNWPTIPQVYLNGEFIGGSDVLIELYQSGELQQMVEVALAS
jgi:monothiol glutaredoxin